MKKDARGLETVRPYRLAHQTLCIHSFSFETESLVGYVEMLLHPQTPDLRRVKINSKQCMIHRVAVNEMWEASFTYNDPTLEICQGESKQRTLDHFEQAHYTTTTAVDADNGNGELTVRLPSEVWPLILEMKSFRVIIEFSLTHPKGGIKFVVPDMDGTMLDRGAHLFTYGHENSSRLWFPCLDCYSEVCTWKLEFTVNMYMTAVSVGDLIETVYTADLRRKTYHYFMGIPTAAPNIALAVGPFEVLVDPHMHEVTHFCLPHLMPVLKHTTDFLYEVFEFYEELLSSRYPYSCYKQVFVDMAYKDVMPYATMTICSINLLHSKKVVDQTPMSRHLMAHAIAQQFFGCFISMNSWSDAWLPKGLASYLCSMHRRKAFGTNEYRYSVAQEMKVVCEHEQNVGPVILDPSMVRDSGLYFPIRHPHTISPAYSAMFEKKCHLIIRMLEIRIGRELMLQVLNKLLALATNASQQKFMSATWYNMLISTGSFLKCISTVTGKDVHTFMDQWVYQGGFARFNVNFVFNRKRNVIELEIKQDFASRGVLRYVGPLPVAVQELDGTFNHTFMIEENKTKFEITCHSKSRRQKKKKIPLCTGEEVDMDLVDTDADSPLLWLRIDPDMTILRSVRLDQSDWMWQYMLRYERCVVAQRAAIMALESFASPKTRMALTEIIENDKCFYLVRIDAAFCLAKVANAMVSTWAGPPAMMAIFRKMFGSHSCPAIVRQNNFTNFQNYFILKALPLAMSTLRNVHSICPPEVLQFLLDLFKYNDNSKNKYSDNYYRAALIDALASTVTPAVTTVSITGSGPSTDALTADTKLILEEITRCLNLEKLLPCYRLTITVSCLKAIRKLQKSGHLPTDSSLFKSYAVEGNFVDVRLVALEALVDYTAVESSSETLSWLLDILERDSDPYLRHRLTLMLAENPPFTRRDNNPLSTEDLVDRLWRLMNSTFAHDSRMRCGVADLYYAMYGRTRPSCLPIPESVMVLNLKERRTHRNPATMTDMQQGQTYEVQESSVIVDPGTYSMEDSHGSMHYRHSLSPLHSPEMEHSAAHYPDIGVHQANIFADEGSQHKFRPSHHATYDTGSPQPGDAIFADQSSQHSGAPNTFFTDEFRGFAGVPSTSYPGLLVPSGVTTPSASVPRVAVEVTVKNEDSEMRLSEESSNSMSPPYRQPAAESTAPTMFTSSMFAPAAGGAGGSLRPQPVVPAPEYTEYRHKQHRPAPKKPRLRHERSSDQLSDEDSLGASSAASNTDSAFNCSDHSSSDM